MKVNDIQSPLSGALFDSLVVGIALVCPVSLQLVQYNEHFLKRCLDGIEAPPSNLDIQSIIPSLKLKLLTKVLGRNRVYRHTENFMFNGNEYPVDFVFSAVELEGSDYILIQGIDNLNALEMTNMVNSYDLLFNAQTQKITQEKEKSQLANQAKSNFLSRISHELKTPMNAILGFAQLQTRALEHSPTLLEFNSHILSAGNDLLKLIEEILDFVALEEHKLKVDIVSCDLNHCLNSAIAQNLEQLKKCNVTVNYQPTDVKIQADEERVIQIIDALLSNGIKFNKSGGVVDIKVSQPDNDNIDIAFKDNGVGLSTEEQKRLFEPLFRSAYAEKNELPGIGIGLVLSQRMVHIMNGMIFCDSNEQLHGDGAQGMTFNLRLLRDKTMDLGR